MNQKARYVTTGDFTPSVLNRQGSEIAGHAKTRPNRLGSVKRPYASYALTAPDGLHGVCVWVCFFFLPTSTHSQRNTHTQTRTHWHTHTHTRTQINREPDTDRQTHTYTALIVDLAYVWFCATCCGNGALRLGPISVIDTVTSLNENWTQNLWHKFLPTSDPDLRWKWSISAWLSIFSNWKWWQ